MIKIVTIISIIGVLAGVSGIALAQEQTSIMPQVVSFEPGASVVSRERLQSGEQVVPVTWEVINRPMSATLVFDQLLPDGTLVNIELPREQEWVNSADSGLVAPVDPGEDETLIYLVLRVIDEETGVMLDYKVRRVTIVPEDDYPALLAVDEAAKEAARETQASPTSVPVSGTRPAVLMGGTSRASGPVKVLGFHIYNEFPAYEDTVLVMWNVVDATEVWIGNQRYPAYDMPCCASGDYNGGIKIAVADLVNGPGEHTIKMEARGAGGSLAAAAFVLNVRSGPLPSQPNAQILDFSASRQTVNLNDSVTFAWSTRDADALTISSSRGEGIIKSVPIANFQPDGSITLAVTDLVNEPGTYWINLEAISNQPGWAGSGFSISLTITG